MFDVISHVADDLKAHAAANKARYVAEVKSILHDLLKTLETEAEKAVVAAAKGADETGPGANVLNAGQVASNQGAADNSADVLNGQEAGTFSPPNAPAAS